MNTDLFDSLEALALAVGKLCKAEGFAPILASLYAKPRPVEVETVRGTLSQSPAEPNALRGKDGVHAQFKFFPSPEEGRAATPEAVVASILYSGGTQTVGLLFDAQPLESCSAMVQSTRERVIEAILTDKVLRARLRERRGFRANNAPDDESYFSNLDEKAADFLALPFVVDRFRSAVGDRLPEGDNEWKAVANRVFVDFARFRASTEYKYRLMAFLNSPSLGHEEVRLGNYEVSGTTFSIVLARVSDLMIAGVYKDESPPRTLPVGLSRANTAICVDFSIPTETTNEDSVIVAESAIECARRVLDVLRMLRSEDLGIGYACIARREDDTPNLTGSSLLNFQESGAVFTPRRGYFGPPAPEALTEDDTQELTSLVSTHIAGVDIRGFSVAIRRFRDGYERYWPGDPEALLDTSIALEALFLGDPGTTELRYRLSVRVARLLSNDRKVRNDLASDIRHLYDIRSKIAHGETVDSLKPSQAEKLRRVMWRAPLILRVALSTFLKGAGPHGITKGETLAEWWSDVELG